MDDGLPSGASAAVLEAAILVVGDDSAERLALRDVLAPLGHPVVEVDSGRAALRAVLRRRFAVILMDARMSTMDGYETELIRARPQSALTPVIILTAGGRDDVEVAAAHASGAVDVISAPIRAEVLRAKVSVFVELFVDSQGLRRALESVGAVNAALRDSERRARAALQHAADGIITAGDGDRIESFNRSARRLFGYGEEELIGQPLGLIIAPTHHDHFAEAAEAAGDLVIAQDVPAEPIETVGRRKDGSCFAMELDLTRTQLGERAFTIACIRDISGRKAYTAALERRAFYDGLAGLPNRALFADRADRAIASADRSGEQLGLMLVDLDDFHHVNETLGRDKADAVLQLAAERLGYAMRGADTVARLGGDEFAIVPSDGTDIEAAASIAWKIRDAFAAPFIVNGAAVNVRASIGIAFFPQHGRTTPDLLRRAERAVREAKQSGSGLAVYAGEPDDHTAERLTLLDELRDGIPRDELVLHFQPKVDLATHRTIGAEALVRWQHPSQGLLMPARFMPDVERSQLVEPLTRWVLDEALHQQRRWNDAGLDLTMAVNISARSLTRRSTLPDTVAMLTETWRIPASRLVLELTENAMADADAPAVLGALHAMGERVAIDDFGTGHSSLAHLQRLPVDEIKVDRSFVTNLASCPSDAVIVRSTIELAHNLGLTVVAEGVEDEPALKMLVGYGCDCAQGHLFSRACPPDELTTWLIESPCGAPVQSSA